MAKAAGRPFSKSWVFLGALGCLSLGVQIGCDPATQLEETSEAVRSLLAAVGPVVIQPALARFQVENALLIEDLDALSADPEQRAPAQDQFIQTMAAWQELEAMQPG